MSPNTLYIILLTADEKSNDSLKISLNKLKYLNKGHSLSSHSQNRIKYRFNLFNGILSIILVEITPYNIIGK